MGVSQRLFIYITCLRMMLSESKGIYGFSQFIRVAVAMRVESTGKDAMEAFRHVY